MFDRSMLTGSEVLFCGGEREIFCLFVPHGLVLAVD